MARPGRPRKYPEPAGNGASGNIDAADMALANHQARQHAAGASQGAPAVQTMPEPPEALDRAPEPPVAPAMYPEPIRLLYNYRPKGIFKVLTHSDPDDPRSPMVERDPIGEREVLDNRGRVVETAKDEFAKVRAGNIVRLSKDEARRLLMSRRAEITDVEF